MATPELIEAMETVFNLAIGNALSQEVEPVSDGDELEREAYRQDKAIERVRRFIQNIKVELNDCGEAISNG